MLEERAFSKRTVLDRAGAFADSMPPAYREAFTPDQIEQHAAISERRRDQVSHLELWKSLSDGVHVLCVVADDRPGLLSNICRVLVAHDLEVLSAQIHCRDRSGTLSPEAFDVFSVRVRGSQKHGARLDASRIDALAADLDSALYVAARSTLPPPGTPPRAGVTTMPPHVFFNTAALRHGEYVLVVEAVDCPGLLLAVSLALHREGVQIVASDVRTEAGLARDCFTIAGANGTQFSSERLATVRQAVVDAVRLRLAEIG